MRQSSHDPHIRRRQRILDIFANGFDIVMSVSDVEV